MTLEELEVTLKMLDIPYCYTKTKQYIHLKNIPMDIAKIIKYLLMDNKFKWIINHNIHSHLDNVYIYIGDKK